MASEFRIQELAKNFWTLALFLLIYNSNAVLSRTMSQNDLGEDWIQHLQKKLNKPAVKTIQSSDGDIIDCVMMNEQPAFDHPDLRDSKVQEPPPRRPAKRDELQPDSKRDTAQINYQLWQINGKCPSGTVPIRRTTAKDIKRWGSPTAYTRKSHKSRHRHPNSTAPPGAIENESHEHAIAFVEGGPFFGAQANINVWNPDVQEDNEFSLSQIWLLGGSFDSNVGNSIEAGWQVFPGLYGDQNPRLFIYWTSDSYRATGCYNLLCSGFVQTSSEIAIGGAIAPLSTPDGPQYDINILVWKDPELGNWWMEYGNTLVGYWPAFLFTGLQQAATVVEWGGEIVNMRDEGGHTSTKMGSGLYAEAGYSRASYFRDLKVVDSDNMLEYPQNMHTFAARPSCYDIEAGSSSSWGRYFFYGGPGKNPSCP